MLWACFLRAKRCAINDGWLLAPFLAALMSFPAQAHLPEYFGRKYVLDGPLERLGAPPCKGDRQRQRAAAEALRQALEQREAAAGPYSADLADPTGELAKLYAQHCNHPAALEHYQNALHKLHISDGLLTTAQLPLLKAMAESYLAIGDLESAQGSLRYAFRVHSMGQGALSAAALDDSLAYFAFARRVFIDPRYPQDITLFHRALKDNAAMVQAQLARDELDYASMERLLLSQLRNLYLVLGTDMSSQPSRDNTNGAWEFMHRSQALSYGKGMRLLEALLDRVDPQSKMTYANLYLRMGNWQHWNGKWQRSCDNYRLAWDAAVSAGEGAAALRGRLAKPAELPEDPELWVSLRDPAIEPRAIIVADFRVSDRGNVSRMDARDSGESSSGIAGRIGRLLRDSHVRPALGDDGCIDGELRGRRYRVLY